MTVKVADFLDQIRRLPDLKTLYVKGGWGAPLNENNKRRVIKAYQYNAARADKINAASADTFAFDCCGIVKSVLWGFSADPTKINGGAQYKANGVPDLSDAGFLSVCTYVSRDFSKIVPGACVFLPGHMGVYIGDGKAVESTPLWKDGCQITRVDNITNKGRGNGRTWKQWGLIPYVDYKEEDMTEAETRDLIYELVPKMFPELMRKYKKVQATLPADDWAVDYIQRVIDAGLMVGDPDGNFRPKADMTRQELAAVLAGMLPDG